MTNAVHIIVVAIAIVIFLINQSITKAFIVPNKPVVGGRSSSWYKKMPSCSYKVKNQPCNFLKIKNLLACAAARAEGNVTGKEADNHLEQAREKVKNAQEELIRILSDIPIDERKLPLLREILRVAERDLMEQTLLAERDLMEQTRLAERDLMEQTRLAEKKLKEEKKLIFYSIDEFDSTEDDRFYITRDIFDKWKSDNKIISKAEDRRRILSFDDIAENGTYILAQQVLKTNFESFAKAEAEVQTRDCVDAIRSGQVLIPPFNEEGT